jgi:DHA1 family tetracycline resistance protein-like MFS transporter
MLRDRRLLTIFVIVCANFLGATLVLPTLPLYAVRHFDATPQQVSMVMAAFFVAQFIAAPWLGRLSDRWGRIPVLIGSQLGTVISFILMGTAGSLELLLLARALDGITGGNIIVAQAYIADISPREKRTQSLGIVWTAFGIGYIVGPAIGGVVGALTDDRTPFYLGALISLGALLMTAAFLREPAARQRKTRVPLKRSEVLPNTPLLLILLLGFMAQIGIALLQSTIALFGKVVVFAGQPDEQINIGVGLLLTTVGIGQVLTQMLLLPRLMPRLGERRLVIVGALLRAVGFFALALLPFHWSLSGLALVLIASASGLMMPALQSLATTSVREDISGSVLGLYQSATTLGIILGTTSSGWLFAQAPGLPYLTAGVLLLVCLLPASVLLRKARDNAVRVGHPVEGGVLEGASD